MSKLELIWMKIGCNYAGRNRSLFNRILLAKEVIKYLRKYLLKEVIQPHLPIGLPCYDFTPITSPTFGRCLLAVSLRTSGVTSFRGVTGGVYKARERIHRVVADTRLLAISTSCGRVADRNLNLDQFYEISSPSRVCSPLYWPL